MLTKYTLRCAFGFVLAGFVHAGVLDVFGFERFEYGSHRARQRARVFFHIVRTVVIPVEIQFRYVTRTFRWKNKNQIISDSFKAVPSSRPFRRRHGHPRKEKQNMLNLESLKQCWPDISMIVFFLSYSTFWYNLNRWNPKAQKIICIVPDTILCLLHRKFQLKILRR